MTMDALKHELKQLIIQTLELEDITPDEIEDDAPLFVDGLGLDSIDALELGLAIKNQYNIKFDANAEQTREYFSSINSLAGYISSKR